MFDRDLIHRSRRAEAITNGLLIDVTTIAQEIGSRFPTALTRMVWNSFVLLPAPATETEQSDRLRTILWLLRAAVLRTGQGDTVHFYLHVRVNDQEAKRFMLKATCGLSDDGQPCLTVMLPDEA